LVVRAEAAATLFGFFFGEKLANNVQLLLIRLPIQKLPIAANILSADEVLHTAVSSSLRLASERRELPVELPALNSLRVSSRDLAAMACPTSGQFVQHWVDEDLPVARIPIYP
jgi:hypothetical protein